MYERGFYIKLPVGNNALSFEKRKSKKLYVTGLICSKEIELGNKVVFEDFDFNGNLISVCGLKNFYEIPWRDKFIYLFDNHNHAYYFWYLSRSRGIIGDGNVLYHIDEHTDMRDPQKYLLKPESYNLQRVFEYTNFTLNVGNYIIPAQKEGIIKDIFQVRSENDLIGVDLKNLQENIILDLDLDFFGPDLDYIDYNLKKKVILEIAEKAKVITVATSPFFMDQKLAIEVFKDLFL